MDAAAHRPSVYKLSATAWPGMRPGVRGCADRSTDPPTPSPTAAISLHRCPVLRFAARRSSSPGADRQSNEGTRRRLALSPPPVWPSPFVTESASRFAFSRLNTRAPQECTTTHASLTLINSITISYGMSYEKLAWFAKSPPPAPPTLPKASRGGTPLQHNATQCKIVTAAAAAPNLAFFVPNR